MGSSLADLQTEPSLLSQIVSSLAVTVRRESEFGAAASLHIDERDLRIAVSKDDERSRRFYAELHRWVTRHQPILALRWWKNASGPMMSVGFVLILFLFLAGFVGREPYKERARALAAAGVTGATQNEALTTLLAIASDYKGNQSSRFNQTALWAILVILPVTAVLSCPPTFVAGLGKGERRIIVWDRWIRFVFVFIPTAIIIPILLQIYVN